MGNKMDASKIMFLFAGSRTSLIYKKPPSVEKRFSLLTNCL